MPIPQIPESYHCNTGEEREGYRRIDNFFNQMMDYIGRDNARPPESQFERRNVGHVRTGRQETDDFTHMLIYHPKASHEKVVACVTEVRTEFNMVQFDFFRNLKDISEGENLPRQRD